MNSKSIAFVRHYHGYTGGHQKVHDYLTHFATFGWQPSIYLNNRAKTNRALFNNVDGVTYQPHYNPNDADVVFLAGMDWTSYLPLKTANKPVINLIQHVRHADKNEPLYSFLKEPAIRLCVSSAVKDAVAPIANGPCHVIKMGHDFEQVSTLYSNDVYILANKQPALGRALAKWVKQQGLSVIIHDCTQEKTNVVHAMSTSKITIALPNKTEGFYLPGIEAMFYSRTAIIPYCVANKEYFTPYSNMIMPDYTEDAIQRAVVVGMKRSRVESRIRGVIGKRIAKQYSLDNERKALSLCLKRYF